MKPRPAKITLDDAACLRRHYDDGDLRLRDLQFDNSPAAMRLWDFVLSEEHRLHAARQRGAKIIGTMKDLGTVPVMAYAAPNALAFYHDGVFWSPCIEMSHRDLAVADELGIDESFCPVRAMLGAFVRGAHFPRPDLLLCSVGATCDDFSVIAQRLEALGWPIFWWEIPARRNPDADEPSIRLPGGFVAPLSLVSFVEGELGRVRRQIERAVAATISDTMLAVSIAIANRARALLAELRTLVFTADACPLPALEMLLAEMLAIHYCSDRAQTLEVYAQLVAEARRRIAADQGVLARDAVRVFWVNPVADLRVMNLLEEVGGRLCGSEFLFCHALDPIAQDVPPMRALAMSALADPMCGPSADRAARIVRDGRAFGSQAVVVCRIPGASHCALETPIFREKITAALGVPVVEIEVLPRSDALLPSLRNRLEALIETARSRRGR